MKSILRKIITRIIPSLNALEHYEKKLADKPAAEVFSTIYRKNVWGGRRHEFYSGWGSRDPLIVDPYIEAVSAHLQQVGRPSIVEIGCGDFNVGRQLAPFASHCTACDIVPDLIEHHRRNSDLEHVEFRVLDAIVDNLPLADIVIIRQVLQHLSNAHITAILPKLRAYREAIITEHVPSGDFVPNLDKETGPHYRAHLGSGIVLTEPPFQIEAKERRVLCEVPSDGGIIRTELYVF
ncbi:class I SAM-dependent methyltransferase [Bradyrhizobium sp. F1.13.3]|uniref:class I SAM-dependent methyltransferase n=1 Tax=Bradyrhizobium sp. F1.13.3 TaxID=3156351 RepID=UPI003394D0F8